MDSAQFKRQKLSKKPLILNLFSEGCPSHLTPGAWAYINDEGHKYNKLDYSRKLAKMAEDAKINAVFLADVLGPYDVYNGPGNYDAVCEAGSQFPLAEASLFVSAMASLTKSLGLCLTFSTVSEAPYLLARRLATLDSLTEGRVSWNVVTTYLDSASRNLLNGQSLPEHDERYVRAEEYINAIYELLLSSWRDYAVIRDAQRQIYADPERVRKINFEGKYFKIPGPGMSEPTPQRLPVISQAGTSSKGVNFAAKHAEIAFLSGYTPGSLKKSIDTINALALEKFGRRPGSIKFVSSIFVILGDTDEEAEAKFKEYQEYFHYEGALALFGGWTGIDLGQYTDEDDLSQVNNDQATQGFVNSFLKDVPGKKTRQYLAQSVGIGDQRKRVFVGSPKTVADELERWVDISGIDGFNFTYASFPESFEDISQMLVPELRKRGLAWDDYPVVGGTFRENLYGIEGKDFVPEDHVAYGYRWRTGSKEDFEEALANYKQNIPK